jgi:hypothetical protein
MVLIGRKIFCNHCNFIPPHSARIAATMAAPLRLCPRGTLQMDEFTKIVRHEKQSPTITLFQNETKDGRRSAKILI